MPDITTALSGEMLVPATATPDGKEVNVCPAAVNTTEPFSSWKLEPELMLGTGTSATVELPPMTRPEEPTYTSVLLIVACGPSCESVVPA